MHRTMRSYELLEPTTIDEAASLLKKYGSKAKLLAGGLDLVSKMRRWQINPAYLVSIRNIDKLRYTKTLNSGDIEIGALASIYDVEHSLEVKNHLPILYETAHQIASVQVKTMGTLVGNLCVATPASDIAPVLLVLGARLNVISLSGKRTIPIEKFFIPVCQHILKPDEIVTSVLVPAQSAGTRCAFSKLSHTAACIAKINVAVSLTIDADLCRDAKIALGAVAPCVIRSDTAESVLINNIINDEIVTEAGNKAAAEASPISDLRSTAEYRQEMVSILVKRAINKAIADPLAI